MTSCIPVLTFICNEGYDCGPRPSYEQQQQQQYIVEQELIQRCQFVRLVIKCLRNKKSSSHPYKIMTFVAVSYQWAEKNT